MQTRRASGTVWIADDDPRLTVIENQTLEGYMHRALASAEMIAPLEHFGGPRARSIAAWLLDHLGDSRTARRAHAETFRQYPEHPVARYFYTITLLNTRGPVHAWLSLEDYSPSDSATAEELADLFSLKARLLAYLGDWRRAEAALAQCSAEALGLPRFASTRATLLERNERRAEAVEVLHEALRELPFDRILAAHAATLLEAENRREEALSLLARVEPRLQTPSLASQRAALESELRLLDAEYESLSRYEQLALKASARTRHEIAVRRAENRYLKGEFRAAIAFGKASEVEYWKTFAEKLEGQSGPPDRRVIELPVSIQEPMGCAPTCVALVANYFGAGVDKVDVADQICYEGTAAHSERGWVEARAWISHEFTVDFEVACALIERGVPFLMVTVQIASAHAQVVVGVDRTRRTFITRDPSSPRLLELPVDLLLETHRAYGPRGHVMLPPDKRHLLDGIVLPERALHDLAHRFRLALEENREEELEARLTELEGQAPEHPLALWARRSLAVHNQDPYAIADCSRAILERFPKDANAELSVLSCLATIGSEQEERERVQQRLDAGKAPWVFYERLAQLLARSASEYGAARRAIRRALRSVPLRGRSLLEWSRLERDAGNVTLALRLSRIAATLEPTDDELARAHFEHTFSKGDSSEALSFLRDRAERYAARSSEPLRVLFGALEWLSLSAEAFVELDAALVRHADDGALLLFAADAHARYRNHERAEALLACARDKVSRATFESHAARLAELAGNLPVALEGYRAAQAALPFSLELNESIAKLVNELNGPNAAREYLTATCRAYPTHCALREMLVRWLRGHDPAHALPELEVLLALQPAHAWGKRERAIVLSELGEHDQAVAEATRVSEMTPNDASSQGVLASVLAAAGKRADAIAPGRRALELWPDRPGAVSSLLRLAGSLSEQAELSEWTWRNLEANSVDGVGMIEWHGYQQGLVSDEALLGTVRPLLEKRASLWTSHHIVARQLLRSGKAAEARQLLEAATQRFPFNARLFLDLAEACQSLTDGEAAVHALEVALRLGPSWTEAVLRAADAYQERGNVARARQTLEHGLNFHPRSSRLMRACALLSWRESQLDIALQQARQAVEFQPEDPDAWATYSRFATIRRQTKDVLQLARELTEQRPWNSQIWLQYAELLRDEGENLASIAALREALDRSPTAQDILDIYMQALTRIGKKQEALEASGRPVSSYFARGAMRARAAWVLWQFGDHDDACLAMRKVLTDHPDQLWGRGELVAWEIERKDHRAAVKQARKLVELGPLSPVSYGYLGAALRKSGQSEEALRAFTDAARLDPSYEFAGNQRLELALEQRRFDDARAVITEQGEHVNQHTRGRWLIALASRRDDVDSALDALRELARHPATPDHAFQPLSQILAQFDNRLLRRALGELVREPDLNPELGSLWISALHQSGDLPTVFELARLRKQHEPTFEAAARSYFDALGERAAFWRVLFAVLWIGRAAHANDLIWGKVGYALAAARAHIATEWWLSGYHRRSGVEAWMLHNYRVAALENYRPRAALRAAEHALSLPADNTLPGHLAFAAFGRAATGNIRHAREILSGRSAATLHGRNHWLFESARMLTEFAEARGEDRAQKLGELRRHILSSKQTLGLFSTATLYRWLADGVLKQQFDLQIALYRGALWLSLVVWICLFGANGAPFGAWFAVILLGSLFYVMRRSAL
ncbi:MAG TPA: C39 family peptidase [Polyangiaceae bacterium]|nr:C39 family peptidase [Polyangiaceae bacterium]